MASRVREVLGVVLILAMAALCPGCSECTYIGCFYELVVHVNSAVDWFPSTQERPLNIVMAIDGKQYATKCPGSSGFAGGVSVACDDQQYNLYVRAVSGALASPGGSLDGTVEFMFVDKQGQPGVQTAHFHTTEGTVEMPNGEGCEPKCVARKASVELR